MKNQLKHGYKVFFPLALVLVTIVLTACKKEVPADYAGNESVYVPEFYSLDGVNAISVCNEYIYYSTSEEEFYRWRPDDSFEPEQLMIPKFDEDAYNWLLQPDLQGGFYVIYQGAEKTCLVRYDEEGTELFRVEITGLTEGYAIEDTAVDGNGHLFIRGGEKVFLFDTDGTYHMTVTASEPEKINRLAGNAKGEVYCWCFSNGGFPDEVIRSVSFPEGLSSSALENYRGGNGFEAYMDTGFLTAFEGRLYLYNEETQLQETLLEWMNCGVETDLVRKFGTLEDGRIVVFLKEASKESGELAILTKTETAQVPPKEVITVGVFTASQNLRRAAARYNRQSEQYRVEVKEYYDYLLDESSGDEGREEARTALHLDMVSGRCPDILNLEYGDLETYVKKGLLEDLTPYIEESKKLDLLPAVLEAYTFDGKIVSLPNRLKIRTIVGRSADIGGEGWTLEEMLDYIDSHENKDAFAVNQQKMLEYCLKLNLSRFVDREKHSCDFMSGDFCRLLEYCSRFSKYSDNAYTSVVVAGDRDAILYEVEINQAEDVMLLRQGLKTEEITFVGFPTDDGGGGNLLEAKEGSYSLFSKSDHKEEAWSFLELLLTDYRTDSLSMATQDSGFPVDRETCERYFAAAMEEPYDTYETQEEDEKVVTRERRVSFSVVYGNKRLYYYVPLPEEIEPIRSLLDTARVDRNSDEQILSVIQEEAEAYFNGNKSAEEVAEVIQSRVSVYLKEQS